MYAWRESSFRDPFKDLLDEMTWDELWLLGIGSFSIRKREQILRDVGVGETPQFLKSEQSIGWAAGSLTGTLPRPAQVSLERASEEHS